MLVPAADDDRSGVIIMCTSSSVQSSYSSGAKILDYHTYIHMYPARWLRSSSTVQYIIFIIVGIVHMPTSPVKTLLDRTGNIRTYYRRVGMVPVPGTVLILPWTVFGRSKK